MQVLRLDHLNLRVAADELESLKQFYCDVIGLNVGFRPNFNTVGYWLYAGEFPILHLSIFKAGSEIAPRARKNVDHFAFQCNDLAQTESHLNSLQVQYQLRRFDDEGLVQIFIQDPVDNTVELQFQL